MYKNWTSEDEAAKFLTWHTHASVEVTKVVLNDWNNRYENPDFYNWGFFSGNYITFWTVTKCIEE